MKGTWIICPDTGDRFIPRKDTPVAVVNVGADAEENAAFNRWLHEHGMHAYKADVFAPQFEVRAPIPAPIPFRADMECDTAKEAIDTPLALLDKLDAFRRSHQNSAEHPSDWCMRCMEAIVANAFGYKERNEWTQRLSEDESTTYHRDLCDPAKSGF